MTTYEHSEYAPAVKRKACKRCGEQVDTFKDPETGLVRQLNLRPITPRMARGDRGVHFAWIDRGPRIGWCPAFFPDLAETRELRFAHECGGHRD